MHSAVRAASTTSSLTAVRTAGAALAAMLLGSFLLFGVGFANSNALHEATHDARHAFGFPCH